MKSFKSMIWVAVVALLLCSCDDDDSLDYIYYYSARATVTSNSGDMLSLRTDGGNHLTIVSDYSGYAPDAGQRTVISYSVVNGENNYYNADLLAAYDLLTKDVVTMTTDNEAQMGNDPIHLYNAWCAGGYLNINFGFNASGSVTHYVNLVENTLIQNPDDGKIYLEFRHNAMGDSENYGKRGTVCFDLKKYQSGSEVLTFVVKFSEFNGTTTTREILYDFTNDTIVEESTEIGNKFYE